MSSYFWATNSASDSWPQEEEYTELETPAVQPKPGTVASSTAALTIRPPFPPSNTIRWPFYAPHLHPCAFRCPFYPPPPGAPQWPWPFPPPVNNANVLQVMPSIPETPKVLLTPSSTASSSTELVDIDEEGEVVQRPPASRATHGEQSDRPTAGPQVPRPARPHAARPTQPRTGPIDGSPDGSFAPESGRSGRLLPNRTMAQGTQLQQQQQQAIKKPRHRVGSAPPGEKTGEKDVESVESEGVDKFGRSVKAQGKSTNRSTQENTRGVITESGGVGTGPAGAAGRERPGPRPTPGSNSNRTRRDASPANTGRAVPVLLLSTRSRESTDVEEDSSEHLPPVSDRSAIAMASASSTYSMSSSRRHRASTPNVEESWNYEDEFIACFVGDQQLSATLTGKQTPDASLLLELLESSTCTIRRATYCGSDPLSGSDKSLPSPAEVLETIRFASSTGSPDALFFDPTQEALIVRDLRGQGSGSGPGPTSSNSPTPTSEWRIAMPRMESSEKLVRLLQRLLLERGALDTLVLHPRWPPRPGPAMPENSRVFDLRPGGRVVRKRADSGHRFERCLSMPFLLPQTGNVRFLVRVTNIGKMRRMRVGVALMNTSSTNASAVPTNSSSTPPAACLLSLENGYLRMDWWDRASAGGHPQNVHYPLAARVGCGPGFANGDMIGVTIDARANTLAFDLNGDRNGFGIAARLPPQPDTRKGRRSGGRTVCAAVEMEEPEQEVELL